MNEDSSRSDVPSKSPDHQCLPVAPETREQWVKRFLESGLSVRKFSATHDIPRMTLWRWVRSAEAARVEVGQLSTNVQFTEVELPMSPGRSDWAAELSLPDGTVLRLSREVPAAMLQQLLRLC